MPTHPTPVYEQLWLIVTFLIILTVRKRLRADGMAIILYVTLYSVGRFFVSFFRVNNSILLGLKEAQLLALATIIVFVPLIVLMEIRARRGNRGPSRVAEGGRGAAPRGHRSRR